MDVKELMIKDWVNYCGVPIQIEQIMPTTGGEDMQPIPLTKEIVCKNGFQGAYQTLCASYYPQGVELERCYIDVSFRRNGEARMLDIHNYDRVFRIDLCNCISVNEFQHALRLCGLDKLADNLII